MGSQSTHQEREFWCGGTRWEEMGGAEAEFKHRLVKLGAERTCHWEGSPGVSHTVLTKWAIPKGMLPAESQAGIAWPCHTQVRQAAPSSSAMHP